MNRNESNNYILHDANIKLSKIATSGYEDLTPRYKKFDTIFEQYSIEKPKNELNCLKYISSSSYIDSMTKKIGQLIRQVAELMDTARKNCHSPYKSPFHKKTLKPLSTPKTSTLMIKRSETEIKKISATPRILRKPKDQWNLRPQILINPEDERISKEEDSRRGKRVMHCCITLFLC